MEVFNVKFEQQLVSSTLFVIVPGSGLFGSGCQKAVRLWKDKTFVFPQSDSRYIEEKIRIRLGETNSFFL